MGNIGLWLLLASSRKKGIRWASCCERCRNGCGGRPGNTRLWLTSSLSCWQLCCVLRSRNWLKQYAASLWSFWIILHFCFYPYLVKYGMMRTADVSIYLRTTTFNFWLPHYVLAMTLRLKTTASGLLFLSFSLCLYCGLEERLTNSAPRCSYRLLVKIGKVKSVLSWTIETQATTCHLAKLLSHHCNTQICTVQRLSLPFKAINNLLDSASSEKSWVAMKCLSSIVVAGLQDSFCSSFLRWQLLLCGFWLISDLLCCHLDAKTARLTWFDSLQLL